MQKARILIVDDEPRYARAIKANLEAGGYHVLVAGDGVSAIKLALQEQPDLIVMDVRLPGIDGYEASRQIRSTVKTPILMLTAMSEVEDKVKGLEIGADDYLTKPFSAAELLARIRALLRRSSAALRPVDVFSWDGLRVDFQKQTVHVNGRLIVLTPKEYCLLCELVRRPGQAFTPEFLLEKIWGAGYGQERRLVWQTVHRLRVKIEPDPANPRFIHTCSGSGYKFSALKPEPSPE